MFSAVYADFCLGPKLVTVTTFKMILFGSCQMNESVLHMPIGH